MGKSDITPGHASLKDLAYWMNERHSIYLRRQEGQSKPWSKDEIFQRWKFTNVFRQLDKGTVAMRKMLSGNHPSDLIAFNIIWYRLFNRAEHAENLGFCFGPDPVRVYIEKCHRTHQKIFTSAYLMSGALSLGEHKYKAYLRAVDHAWKLRNAIVDICRGQCMEAVFLYLKNSIPNVGSFVAYELVCDFRFTPLLSSAKDRRTWANLGPGAKRGLRHLGMPETLESMSKIFIWLCDHLEPHIWDCHWPFELREVEHSLCEFDKYQRIKTGAGRPRQKYNGTA